MVRVNPGTVINKTCGTVINGMLVVSLIASGCGCATIADSSQIQVAKQNITYPNSISETPSTSNGINYPIFGYNPYELNNSGVETMFISEEMRLNLSKLATIEQLADDWNGNGAKAFEYAFISKVRMIIAALEIQPELFPTADNSIQIEYEKEDGSYLEIQLSLNETCDVYEICTNGEERDFTIANEVGAINEVVNRFYG